jgi:hypothetical protein
VLQSVGKRFIGRKEHVENLVFVEDREGIFEVEQVQIILQDAGVLEDIHAAVDEVAKSRIPPAKIASP